jgi:tetratricopeptide (TPR) repeat protein
MRSIVLSVVVSAAVVSAAVGVVPTRAAEQVIGTSDAQACYEAATFNPTIADEASCNAAIKRGKLSRPQLAATYSNRGIILANHGELDKAIEDQNAAIALDPDSARAHVNRGNVYYRYNRHNEAVADYNQAITLSHGALAPAYFNRGKSHLALGETDAAAQDFQQAASLAPETYK